MEVFGVTLRSEDRGRNSQGTAFIVWHRLPLSHSA